LLAFDRAYSPDMSRDRINMTGQYPRVLDLTAEVLRLAERIKPSQYAKRQLLAKKGLLGTKIDEWVTAIMYSVYKKLGIIDRIIKLCIGSEQEDLPLYIKELFRVIVNEVYFDKRTEAKMKIVIRKVLSAKGFLNYYPLAEKLIHCSANFEPPEPKDIFEEIFWKYNFPEWFTKRLIEILGSIDEAIKLIKIWNTKAPLSLRVNSLKIKPEELKEILWKKYKVYIEYGKFTRYILKVYGTIPFNRSKEFEDGLFIVQDEASALVSYILDPKPGERIIDMCAAPGGKTTHIGELMKNRGRIVALDVSKPRLDRLVWQCRRLGISIVEPRLMDARKAPEIFGENSFDRVLLDAPCTSSGTIRKNPEIRWLLKEKEIPEYAKLQKELLEAAIRLVKPRGTLIYATCSVFPEENEWVLKSLLDRESSAELQEITWPKVETRGLEHIDPEMRKTIRLWTHRHDTTSFFIAKLTKQDKS
jgi:16S rRNA (cytosine967-C5)-methyltransferase